MTLEWLPSLDDACLEMLVAKQPGLTKLSLAGVGVTHLAPVAALAPTLTDLSVVHVMVGLTERFVLCTCGCALCTWGRVDGTRGGFFSR